MTKQFFVTGGSRGIGRAIVVEAVRRLNANVVFTYYKREDLAFTLVDELKDSGLKIIPIKLDLKNAEEIKQTLPKVLEQHGPFDGIVHNAAIVQDNAFFFMQENEWKTVTDVALNSFFYITQAFLPHMIQNRWGRVVTIASVSGEAGNRGQTNYAAAKGALISATKSLAREVAMKNVLVNCVSPGVIDTDMIQHIPKEEVKRLIPIGRFGRPEEVASVVRFLMSEDASYVNGAVIRVNGGLYT